MMNYVLTLLVNYRTVFYRKIKVTGWKVMKIINRFFTYILPKKVEPKKPFNVFNREW